MSLLHRLLHGHWPEWVACCYDFLTWDYFCAVCEPAWAAEHRADSGVAR